MSETSTLQWEIEQLVKAKLFLDEQAVVRSALRALYASQPELRRQMVICAYTAGKISLGKAAEMLGVSHEEMKDILREKGVEIHLCPQTTEDLLRDAAMAYGEASATVLRGWEVDQLLKLREQQPDLVEPALQRLVQENPDIRWSVVVGAYRDRQINLGKAAELLGLTEIELFDRFVELGIPLRIGSADLAEARAEVEAMRVWFSNTKAKDGS